MDYKKLLADIQLEVQPYFGRGKPADYIPALSTVPPGKFGMSLTTVDATTYSVGDAIEPFSIQSIGKVITLTMAIRIMGEKIWDRVGKKASAMPFNSIVQLEYERGFPANPFINAGALVVMDAVLSIHDNAIEMIESFARDLAGNPTIGYDKAIAESEKQHGYRNAALANFMKSYGLIDNAIDDLLDAYFNLCALSMSTEDLSKAMTFLANRGKSPITGKQISTANSAKKLNALLLTCGMYDDSGDFAYRVGIPGKSGVGGGIVGIIPNQMALCVWSPELNASGSSILGVKALELFTSRTGLSLF